MAPSINQNQKCVVLLKEQSVLKKKRRKPCRNRPINNIRTPCFRICSRRALYDLPQSLQRDTARRGHPKRLFIFAPTHSFSYRVHGKIRRNCPTCRFSSSVSHQLSRRSSIFDLLAAEQHRSLSFILQVTLVRFF